MRLAYRSIVALLLCLAGSVALPFLSLDSAPFHWQLFAQSYDKCVADKTTLCLSDGRFQVRTLWSSQGGAGQGQAVALTGDTGYFWFFDKNNVEMVIKVLNACSINNAFWVFAGGLTDVRVEMSVIDTETGVPRGYQNPLNTPFQPIQDTRAFSTCP